MIRKLLKVFKYLLGLILPGFAVYYGYQKLKSRIKPSRIRILINPLAGKGKTKETVASIRNALAERFPDSGVEILFSRSRGDLAELAREAVKDNCEMVVVCGGDGAVNEVVQGLAGSRVVLGVIPLGTGNVFAQEMKIPDDIEEACGVLAAGQIKRVDVGVASDKHFLWLAGVGADALVAQELTSEMKDRLGVFSYFVFALKHLGKLPYSRVKIRHDGGEHSCQALCVIVGNAATYDGQLNIKSVENMGDGFLDVCVAQRVTSLGIARQIFWFLMGRKTYYRDIQYFDVKYFHTRRVKIESDPPVYVHTDGEVIGKTPCEFTILPKALSIILPEG